jgi:hypothetical protein
MRLVIAVIGVLVTAVSAVGCAAVAAPPAGALPSRHASTPPPPAVPGPPAGSRAEAAALAGQLLSRLRLPASARRLPATPLPASLSQPAFFPVASVTYLDLHQLFAVAQPLDALADVMAARVPAGMSWESTGQGGGPGGVTERDVSYVPRSVPAGIYSAQLVLTMVPAGSGGSLLRADAQVIWYPPRTAAEYIDPARYRVLTVTVTVSGRSQQVITRVVTSRTVIGQLARALNRSQAEPALNLNCPLIFADYRLAFAVSRHRRPVVVVSATRWPCGGTGITVGGQPQPPLADNGAVVAIVDRALGINPRP